MHNYLCITTKLSKIRANTVAKNWKIHFKILLLHSIFTNK